MNDPCMIKLFIKYSYIFCKQDKKLQIFFKYYENDIYKLFCGYSLIKHKLIHAYQLDNYFYYIIKFDPGKYISKYVYIWNQFDNRSYLIDDFKLLEINKLFKEFKKEWESLQNENI